MSVVSRNHGVSSGLSIEAAMVILPPGALVSAAAGGDSIVS